MSNGYSKEKCRSEARPRHCPAILHKLNDEGHDCCQLAAGHDGEHSGVGGFTWTDAHRLASRCEPAHCTGEAKVKSRNVANEDPLAWSLATSFTQEHCRELHEMSTSTIRFRARLAELIADVRANRFYPKSPALTGSPADSVSKPDAPSEAFISGYNAGRHTPGAYDIQQAWVTYRQHGGARTETPKVIEELEAELARSRATTVALLAERDGLKAIAEAARKVGRNTPYSLIGELMALYSTIERVDATLTGSDEQ